MDNKEFDQTIAVLCRQMKRKTRRNFASGEFIELAHDNLFFGHQDLAIRALATFTEMLSYHDELPTEPIIDNISDLLVHLEENNPEFVQAYLSNQDKELAEWDDPETKYELYVQNTFSKFGIAFREICNNIVTPYEGHHFKISKDLESHGKSLLIMSDRPESSILIMPHDTPRSPFEMQKGSLHIEQQSGEKYISEMYGTDGKCFEHYSSFIKCPDRYPALKYLF